jgi:hypothetical protein
VLRHHFLCLRVALDQQLIGREQRAVDSTCRSPSPRNSRRRKPETPERSLDASRATASSTTRAARLRGGPRSNSGTPRLARSITTRFVPLSATDGDDAIVVLCRVAGDFPAVRWNFNMSSGSTTRRLRRWRFADGVPGGLPPSCRAESDATWPNPYLNLRKWVIRRAHRLRA